MWWEKWGVFILIYYKCSFPDVSIVSWLNLICVLDDLQHVFTSLLQRLNTWTSYVDDSRIWACM